MSNYISIVDNADFDFGNLSTSGNQYQLTTGATYNYTMDTGKVMITAEDNSGVINCKGENADILLNGMSVRKTLEAIEDRLAILRPNEQLESEWEELKELGRRYRELEAEIKEKTRVWDILKRSNDGYR